MMLMLAFEKDEYKSWLDCKKPELKQMKILFYEQKHSTLRSFSSFIAIFLSRKKNVLKQYRVVAIVKQTNTTAEP